MLQMLHRHMDHNLRRAGCVCILVSLVLSLLSCDGGNNGNPSPPERSAQTEQQAIRNLLDLYRTALLEEDIDRLQALLQPGATQEFRETMTATFRSLAIIDHQIPDGDIVIADDRHSVTFREVESVEDPATLVQQTRLYSTTFQLAQEETPGVLTFLIASVMRQGPVVKVTTPGRVQAKTPAQIDVSTTDDTMSLVEVEVPETGAMETLEAVAGGFRGHFTPPGHPAPEPLRVNLHDSSGEVIVLPHRYRLRVPGDGEVQPVAGTDTVSLFAVTLAPDGTVWAGGKEPPLAGATLYQVSPGATSAERFAVLTGPPASGQDEDFTRVEDLVVDRLGRLHVVFFAPPSDDGPGANGDVIVDHGVFCQTVNAFDPTYPFRVPDRQSGQLHPSASARALTADDGNIWLFGSDGGVARVVDGFRDGQCPMGVAVRYDPLFQRQEGGLLSNTVPALAVGADDALWFGTAFGLTRLQDGQFTPVPFDPALSLQGDVATLETFFQDVADAIFNARPVSSVGLDGLSFVEQFGAPLVKADLIFSAIEDTQRRLWAGTLGGGVRLVEANGSTLQDTLHLTRQDGLASNIIFALAEGPDGSIWIATEEGVSRIRATGDTVTITTFSALDGLVLPVRDVVVDADNVVWLATDGGLFRIVP